MQGQTTLMVLLCIARPALRDFRPSTCLDSRAQETITTFLRFLDSAGPEVDVRAPWTLRGTAACIPWRCSPMMKRMEWASVSTYAADP